MQIYDVTIFTSHCTVVLKKRQNAYTLEEVAYKILHIVSRYEVLKFYDIGDVASSGDKITSDVVPSRIKDSQRRSTCDFLQPYVLRLLKNAVTCR